MKYLVCMLEFPTWELAKPWSYISGYAFVDALRELGHEVELCVLMYGFSEARMVSAIDQFRRQGKRFDCAFFWMPHLEYSAAFWESAARLCEKRVGVIVESLSHTPEEIGLLPHLKHRREIVLRGLRRCTHALTFDYHDYRYLERRGYRAFWTPGIVPDVPPGVCADSREKSNKLLAAGTIYDGRRKELHGALVARGILEGNERLEHSKALVDEFSQASAELIAQSCSGERLLEVRRQIWHEYIRHLSRFAGVISLPAYYKGFPGRIFEAFLANCLALVCEGSDLARHKRVFKDGVHLFYLGGDPDGGDIDRLGIVGMVSDAGFRERFTAAAKEHALRQCGAKLVLERLLNWINNPRARGLDRLPGGLFLAFPFLRRPGFYREINYEAS